MIVRSDIGLFSTDQKISARCLEISKAYSYSCQTVATNHDFQTNPIEFRLIVIGGAHFPNGGEFISLLKEIRKACPENFILYIETRESINNSINLAIENGADYSFNETEFFDTSKADYIFTQVVRATFLPIRSTDIVLNHEITFDIYHLLPQREKFLKFVFVGDSIDANRLEKLRSVNELYIHRNQAEQYAQYLNTSTDNSENGLNLRCRGQFLALYASYMKLVLSLTDQSVRQSYERGINLFHHCETLAKSLLSVLAAHPNPWIIINSSTIGEFGSVERGPAVASYTAIIASKLNIPKIEELMVAALLSEIGLLFLTRTLTTSLRDGTIDQLPPEKIAEFEKYPLKSIAAALTQKIQFPEAFRNMLIGIHERADKQGFPHKRFGRNIPIESFIIHFAYQLDRRTVVRMGKARVTVEEAIVGFLREELAEPKHFTLEFIQKLKAALNLNL
jgi:response regulator RpfG family c-di-GMP phosphodiesterase